MLGISKYCSRSELLRRKATGFVPDVSPSLQAVFDRGHATEIGGREMAEKIIGQHLYPHTVSEGKLSASCDGITRDHKIAFEHKQYRADLADSVRAGVLPEEYRPQCQQVMMVTGADMLLFMVSDGTPANCAYMWVEPDSEWRQTIVQGWTQFAIDLENYVPTEATVAPVAATIEALPALMIQVEGKVLATNLDQFKASAQKFIDNINTDLQTDQDFADADKMVKFLKDGEERLALCKSQALAQTASIDELFRTIDAISGQMKDKRLMLDRLVKSEKEHRRADIVATAQAELVSHIGRLNERIGGRWMPIIGSPAFPSTMFGEVIKGLKSLDSMRDKVSAAMTNAKIEANEIADRIELNARAAKDHMHLLPDFAGVCAKAADDFAALLALRVQQEAARADAQAKAQAATDTVNQQTTATADVKRASVVAAQDDIADFINSRNFGTTSPNQVRAILVEFVKFKAERAIVTTA